MGVVEHYLEELEKRRNIKLPICIFNADGLAELNNAFATEKAYLVSQFYKNFNKFIDVSCFEKVAKNVKERAPIGDVDIKLIEALVKIKRQDSEFFFDYVGNLYYLAELVDQLKFIEPERKVIRVSLMLFAYVNMVEVVTRLLSKLIKDLIYERKETKDYENFLSEFKDGEHPTLGRTLGTMERLALLSNARDSLLQKNKDIRNKISHANIFYDSGREKIYFTNGREVSPEVIKEDMSLLFNFLNEFIYQLNGKDENLLKTINPAFSKMANMFLKIQRSGPLKRAFNFVIFSLRDEN